MAANRGVEVCESLADIQQKLSLNGENLQSSTSTLLLEMKVLNKLIYKSKNTHNKEKFFKCLERIKKCLNKCKLLCLDKKVSSASKYVGETENLSEILNEIILGGQLAIRVIILCQETVQYSLAYLSRGFFVTLHVTLLSLVCRIWVLQKDCWLNLVECYQLVRSLIQLTENHVNLNEFPECLKSWLSEDANKIFDGRGASVNDPLSGINSSNPIFQQLFKENNGSDTPTMFDDESIHDELDLGEPVEEMRELHFDDKNIYATLESANDKTVSGLKTNLTLKFDSERVECKNLRKNESSKRLEQSTKLEKSLNEIASKDCHTVTMARCKPEELGERKIQCKADELGERKIQCKADELRKSDKKLVMTRLRRSLHCRENTIFIKKTPYRYTLRSLLATADYTKFSVKRLQILLKFVKFALHLQKVLVSQRKILLRIRDTLERELRKRRLAKNQRKKDELFFSRKRDAHEDDRISRKNCTESGKSRIMCYPTKDEQEFGTKRKTDMHKGSVSGKPKISRNVFKEGEKREITCYQKKDKQESGRNKLFIGRQLKGCSRNEAFQRVDLMDLKNNTTFSNENQKERETRNKNIEQDEIDDIFGSLDF